MGDRIMEELYPDDYDSRPYRLQDREVKYVSSLNCAWLAQNANEEYDFLLSHPLKPAFYMVDWRVIYSVLYDFLRSADIQGFISEEMSVLQKFQINYEG